MVAGVVVIGAGFFASKGSQTADTEIWNGQVVSKERKHDTYERPYECRCRTVTSGSGANKTTSRQCDTCYETRYTVHWNCQTTVGEYTIDSEDSSWRSVYDTPDPERYTIIKKGDPVAKRMAYVNYVQAVPNSLFTPAASDLKQQFKHLLPAYPENVYDFYKLDRFITPGWAPADAAEWNKEISMGLRELGPRKQVNLIVVIAKTNDSNYEYALRDHWEGANKNDVVLLIGSAQYPKIDFVRVISWTRAELFKVELRDAVEEKGAIDRSIVPLALEHINKNFERRRMREFAYLDGEIDPPQWLVWTLLFLAVAGAGVTYVLAPQRFGNVRFHRRRHRF